MSGAEGEGAVSLYPSKPCSAGAQALLGRGGCTSLPSPPILLFDVSLAGFHRWCRRRLELLGIRTVLTRYKYDHHIAEEARRLGAIVVTADRGFCYEPKIVLPMCKPKYETWLTLLLKKLKEVLGSEREGENSEH